METYRTIELTKAEYLALLDALETELEALDDSIHESLETEAYDTNIRAIFHKLVNPTD